MTTRDEVPDMGLKMARVKSSLGNFKNLRTGSKILVKSFVLNVIFSPLRVRERQARRPHSNLADL